MIVQIGDASRLSLKDPTNMRAFKLVAVSQRALTPFRNGDGPVEIAADGFAWVQQDWIRAASGLSDSAEWLEAFARMIDFATGKGWVRDRDGAVRAHIEYG